MKTPGPAGPVQGKCRNGNYALGNSSLHLAAWLTPGAIFSLPAGAAEQKWPAPGYCRQSAGLWQYL